MGKNKKIHLQNISVQNYAAEGKCIARLDNKVIFITGAVPGDVVDIFVTKNKKDYAEAIVTKLVEPSAERQNAHCIHFGTCGGCKWQMLPYNFQAQYKQQQVFDVLTRIGGIPSDVFLPIVSAKQEYYYRNKLEFTFSNKKFLPSSQLNDGQVSNIQNVLGYHAPRLWDKVIDINECHLMQEPQNAIRNGLRNFAIENNYSFYDIANHTGLLRNIMIRTTTQNETLVCLMFGQNNELAIENTMQFLKNNFSITSLHYTVNEKLNDSIYDLEIKHYDGNAFITEKLEEFSFKISVKSFFQTNTIQAQALYNVVRQFAQIQPGQVLYDLYCGTGSIGIFCSKQISKIIGVDSVGSAIEDAQFNAQQNNIDNAHFFAGDVIKICNTQFFETHGHADVIICDPPRAGMHNTLLEKLLEISAPKIVYVSCNPATQARDLQTLSKKYKITKVQAVDMFPQTHHVESVALLELV